MHLHRSTALKEIEENSWLCFFHFPNVKNWSSWSFISDLHFENCVWGDGEWHEHFFLSTGDFLTRSSAPRPGLHLKKTPGSFLLPREGKLQGGVCKAGPVPTQGTVLGPAAMAEQAAEWTVAGPCELGLVAEEDIQCHREGWWHSRRGSSYQVAAPSSAPFLGCNLVAKRFKLKTFGCTGGV